MTQPSPSLAPALQALAARDASTRLRAALALGTTPDPAAIARLIERCAVEPDFHVREMLTWALTRLPRERTVPALLGELSSDVAQARSQALHTLSKVGVPEAWPLVFPNLLTDPDDEVARAAWRVAVGIVPPGSEGQLTDVLVSQFGRGDLEMQKSLARALGELFIRFEPTLAAVERSGADAADAAVAAQARATACVLGDPGASFPGALAQARRLLGLDPEPVSGSPAP